MMLFSVDKPNWGFLLRCLSSWFASEIRILYVGLLQVPCINLVKVEVRQIFKFDKFRLKDALSEENCLNDALSLHLVFQNGNRIVAIPL